MSDVVDKASRIASLTIGLIEARKLLRGLYEDYPERVMPFRRVVRGLADEGGGHLAAGVSLARELEAGGVGGSSPLWVLAAAVEEMDREGQW